MAVTADVKGTAILRNKVADYLNTEPGGESPAYHLMNVFETIGTRRWLKNTIHRTKQPRS